MSRPGRQLSYPIYPAFCNTASPTYNKWVKLTAADVHGLRQEPGFEGQAVYFHLNHPLRFVYLVGTVTAIDFPTERIVLLTLDDGSGETIELKVSRLLPPSTKAWEKTSISQTAAQAEQRDGSQADASGDEDSDETDKEEATEAGSSEHLKDGPTSAQDLAPQIPDTSVKNLKITSRCSDVFCDERRHIEIDQSLVTIGTVLKAKGTLTTFRTTYQVDLERVDIVRSVDEEYRIWTDYALFCSETLSRPWALSSEKVEELEDMTRARLHAQEQADRDAAENRRQRQAKIQVLREANARYEERAERRRQAMAIELDGNPLDRLSHADASGKPKRDSAKPLPSKAVRRQERSSAFREQAIRRRHAVRLGGT